MDRIIVHGAWHMQGCGTEARSETSTLDFIERPILHPVLPLDLVDNVRRRSLERAVVVREVHVCIVGHELAGHVLVAVVVLRRGAAPGSLLGLGFLERAPTDATEHCVQGSEVRVVLGEFAMTLRINMLGQ